MEMAIHQGAEGTSEVTHRRKMLHQPRALLQQLPHDIHPGAQGKQWKASAAAAIGCRAWMNRCHSSTAEGPFRCRMVVSKSAGPTPMEQ